MNILLDAVEDIIPIDRDWANQQIPRCHGNGFLQLPVTEDARIHVWDPRIPNVREMSQIHDHRRGFKSHILAGEIINVVYNVEYSAVGDYLVYYGDHKKHCLVPAKLRASVSEVSRQLHKREGTYSILWGEFHESIATYCCTLMVRKNDTVLERSTVLASSKVETTHYHRLSVDDEILKQILQDVERVL